MADDRILFVHYIGLVWLSPYFRAISALPLIMLSLWLTIITYNDSTNITHSKIYNFEEKLARLQAFLFEVAAAISRLNGMG